MSSLLHLIVLSPTWQYNILFILICNKLVNSSDLCYDLDRFFLIPKKVVHVFSSNKIILIVQNLKHKFNKID